MKYNTMNRIGCFSFLLGSFWTLGLLLSAQYKVGDTVEDFSLKNVDGKEISLLNHKEAKGFIVVFTCNTCPFSQAYEDRLIQLSEKYTPQNFHVIAINSNDPERSKGDSFEKMKERHQNKKFNFPYLYDETQEIAKKFGANRTPHVYILQKSGQVLQVAYIGAIDDNSWKVDKVKKKYVENAVDYLIAGKPIPAEEKNTKAVGCSIKWRKS
ncbi:MAG: thioredoxin family protein [Cytophagales bacterium]|nr:thioredoxin family protein [Cytophagales bacterium]